MAVEHVTYTDVNTGKIWRRWGNGGGGGGGGEARRDGEGRTAGIETFGVGRSWVPRATVEEAHEIRPSSFTRRKYPKVR